MRKSCIKSSLSTSGRRTLSYSLGLWSFGVLTKLAVTVQLMQEGQQDVGVGSFKFVDAQNGS